MKNNVYVRNNRSIFTISIVRITLLIPLIIYGFYKNGIYLYQKGYVGVLGMFRPLVFIIGGGIIGGLVNYIYERLIKKNKSGLKEVLFSSFHIEYGLVLGCIMPVSINAIIYFSTVFVLLFLSKFTRNRINIMCLTFIAIYCLSIFLNIFEYANIYELSRAFSYEFMDYLIGKAPGGIAATHIVLLMVALFGLYITNNSKTSITFYALISSFVLFGVYAMIANVNFPNIIFGYNMIFIYTYVATDSVTSSYTKYGKKVFGALVGILSFGFYFVNPIIAPYIAIIIVSLFNNLIDRKFSKLFHKDIVNN